MKFYLTIITLVVNILTFGQRYNSEEIQLIRDASADVAMPIFQTNVEQQHATLLNVSSDAPAKDPLTKVLVNRMKLSLIASGGVGIAAPQVGINRKIIWVKRYDKDQQPFEYFINPKITWRSKIQNYGPEGDLSISDFRDSFYRSMVIQLSYVDLQGKQHSEIVEGFTAVILQHEIDHLFGILISDKILKQQNDAYQPVNLYQKNEN